MSGSSCWDRLAPSTKGTGRVMSHMWVTEVCLLYCAMINTYHFLSSTMFPALYLELQKPNLILMTTKMESYFYVHFEEIETEISWPLFPCS